MGLEDELQEALSYLRLADIPTEWVDSLWQGNFCNETVTLPYQAVEESVLLDEESWGKLVEACRQWLKPCNEAEDRVGFWTALMEVDVTYKCVLAVLHSLMERSKMRAVDRICAVQASRVYHMMLQLPDAAGYKLFHPMIFQKSLDVFHLFPENVAMKNKDVSIKPNTKRRRGKRRRRQIEEEGEDSVVEEGEDTRNESLSEEGGNETVKILLHQLIRELYLTLNQMSLKEYEVSRYQLVQVLLRMARMELGQSSPLVLGALNGRSSPVGQSAPMYGLAWKCISTLCQALHGPVESIITEVFRQLLPSLLMLSENGSVLTSTPLPSSLVACSKHALSFVDHVTGNFVQQVYTPLKKLIQHICTKIPDRAEYRNKMSVSVCHLLSLLPDDHCSEMMDWLYKFSRNTKIGYRVFAIDLFAELLLLKPRTPQPGSLSDEGCYKMTNKFLVRVIISRCSDKAPSVRGKALTCLSSVATNESPDLAADVKSSIFPRLPSSNPGSKGLVIEMIHRRTADEKVGVRKAGLQVLEAIIHLDKTKIRTEDIVAIHERCLDSALSVRKQAITSLTSILLRRKENTEIQSYWLDGLLPMVIDKEAGAEEKCLRLLQDVILDKLTLLGKSTGEEHHLAWRLLSLIAEEDRVDLQRYLRRAMGAWSRSRQLTDSMVKAICSHTEKEEHLKASWMLLAEVTQFFKSVENKFVFDSWRKYFVSVSRETSSPLVQILVVIGNLASTMSKIAVQDIKEDIIELLGEFKLGPAVIQPAVNTLCLVSSALYPKQEYQASLDKWCIPLLKSCEDYISSLIKEKVDVETGSTEVEILTYLFTLGEVAQLCPSHTSHHLCLMIQSILLASSEVSDHTPNSLPSSQGSSVTSSQGSSLQNSRPGTSQTLKSFLSGLSGLTLSSTLRAHAYITLGKLCLQNEDLAKKSVIQMAKELLTSKHPAVRNNIVVILCDLAVRYSTRVDPYIHTISSCLKDESLLVRKQTLTLLARLLQEDYIKWKGSLFFHFVSTLIDEGIIRFSEFCLVHLLQVKHPAMFYHHFVESIFFFNSYESHKVYNRFKQTDRERELFSLKGKKNTEKRMRIYTFLLSHMTDEYRFQLTAKLCQEVIGGLVDRAIPLDDESVGVVRDTLAILSCKEIKLSTLRRNVGEDLADEGDQVGAAVAKAQTKIISQIVKKNVMENVVPIVIAAKHLFENQHNPLLRDLLLYLKELMQDYRNEVGEVLAGDPQLAQEIQFDLKRFDEEQKRATQTPATPQSIMASPLLSPGVQGHVSMATILATPPMLKTPVHVGSVRRLHPNGARTPFRLPLGMSPLVVTNKKILPPHHSSSNKNPILDKTPSRVSPSNLHRARGGQGNGGGGEAAHLVGEGGDGDDGDVASPASARARANEVSMDYMAIKTPATLRKKPLVPLQRAVLTTAAQRVGRKTALSMPAPQDETILAGRLASTPEGYAESVSFRVSMLIPPSPIPQNSTLCEFRGITPAHPGDGRGRGGRKQSKRVKMALAHDAEVGGAQCADIVMPSPDTESKQISKWKVQVK